MDALEIGEIRGVNTSGVLSTLLERHLIKIVGRKNVVGRPFLYATTKEFLIRFGLTAVVWRPLVELTRRRHLKFRQRLAERSEEVREARTVVSAGV